MPQNNNTPHPFALDQEYLQQVQSDPNYDYLSDIHPLETQTTPTTTTTTDTSTTTISLPKPNRSRGSEQMYSWLAIIIIGAIALLLIWRAIKFAIAPSDDDIEGFDRQMGNDTISGHSWQEEISQLMADGNYSEVVVLCYLRRLERLDTDGIIRFRPYKTPGMFLAEASKNLRTDEHPDAEGQIDALSQLTTNYLRVRYGHYAADAATANKMLAL